MQKSLSISSKNKRRLLISLSLVAGISAAAFSYSKYTQTQTELARLKQQTISDTQPDNQNDEIISKVLQLVDFSDTSTPTVATVSDTNKLTDQSFFARAQNGDKVLVFSEAKRAILYRPSTNKIIEVAPVNLNSPATASGQVASAFTTPTPTKPTISPTPSPAPTPSSKSLSILLLNGTTTAGITSKLETPIKNFYPQALFEKQSANKSDYQKTQIIALRDSAKSVVDKLAVELSLEKISESPYGEDLSGAYDIAILVGSDQIKN